jgi:16S rRNA (cytosine1402-N4)-methyltransferase
VSAAIRSPASQTTDVAHRPVLLSEVIDALKPRDGGIYVDGTFGAGGYSRAMLDAASCSVYGIDRDPTAIASGQKLVQEYDGRLTLLEGCYGDMDQLLAEPLARLGVESVDGVALDLGVSSMQLDQAERGFSFRFDGPLDMRMGGEGISAADIVNTWEEKRIADVIFRYGEERHSRRIARAIVREREREPIATTLRLAEIVRRAIGKGDDRIDPATRTFQALRIAVNDELGELERGLEAAQALLREQGRLAVVSFHSLEDRIVKDFMRERSDAAPRPSRHMPDIGRKVEAPFRLVSRRPILPNETETALNTRARSAKLRVAEATGVGVRAEGGRA